MASSNLPQATSLDDYAVNQTLTLDVRSEYVTDLPSTIRVRIRQLHTRTLSCTMIVDILGENQPLSSENPVFLKLFDRRFSEQLRRDWGIDPWPRSMESAYLESVKSGAVDTFLHDLHHIPSYQDETEEDWDDAQNEAYLVDVLSGLYKSEVVVYNALREHQGRIIPRFFAGVDLDIMPPGVDPQLHNKDMEPFKVKGILIEFVRGHDMRQLPLQFPRSSWQDLVDQAVAIVEVLGDHDILNKDVRLENFLLFERRDGGSKRYGVFMIDFALCRIRGRDESDLEWGRAKCSLGEDRAVTARMNTLLKKYEFSLNYEVSTRWDEWADTDTSIPADFVRTVLPGGVVAWSHPQLPVNRDRVREKADYS